MGGWKLYVEVRQWVPSADIPRRNYKGSGVIDVTGFDTSLSENDIEKAIIKHFSSCGEVDEVILLECHKKVRVVIIGEDAVEKALKLSACGCNVEGCKLLVAKKYIHPKRHRGRTGYTLPDPSTKGAKKAKV